mmetsp:Transcript_7066/g.13926  ORF Transcript_7066/g.13926 Transcript_7066/m.13926 type:complete len:233 (+) Transcript_7066:1427-2125(+)
MDISFFPFDSFFFPFDISFFFPFDSFFFPSTFLGLLLLLRRLHLSCQRLLGLQLLLRLRAPFENLQRRVPGHVIGKGERINDDTDRSDQCLGPLRTFLASSSSSCLITIVPSSTPHQCAFVQSETVLTKQVIRATASASSLSSTQLQKAQVLIQQLVILRPRQVACQSAQGADRRVYDTGSFIYIRLLLLVRSVTFVAAIRDDLLNQRQHDFLQTRPLLPTGRGRRGGRSDT